MHTRIMLAGTGLTLVILTSLAFACTSDYATVQYKCPSCNGSVQLTLCQGYKGEVCEDYVDDKFCGNGNCEVVGGGACIPPSPLPKRSEANLLPGSDVLFRNTESIACNKHALEEWLQSRQSHVER